MLGYVDTSCLVSIAFSESGHQQLSRRLASCDHLFSSNLLEAELLSSLAREEIDGADRSFLQGIVWIYPNRSLSSECAQVLAHGRLKGAETWHLACALYLRAELGSLEFFSANPRQIEAARALDLTRLPASQ